MSIKVSSAVWSYSHYSGGALLVLLAMADWANDDGTGIFPLMETLARKARLTVRGAQKIVRALESDGVVECVSVSTGKPGRANEYRIVVDRLKPELPCEQAQGVNSVHPSTGELSSPVINDGRTEQHGRVNLDAETGELRAAYIDKHHRNRHESVIARARECVGAGAPVRAAPPVNGRSDALANSAGQIAGPEISKGHGGDATGKVIADLGQGAPAKDACHTWAQQRSRALVKQIGELKFATWFADAEFVEGPPPTILMSSGFRSNWASNHFGSQLRKVFGDDVQVTHRKPQSEHTDEENDDRADDG